MVAEGFAPRPTGQVGVGTGWFLDSGARIDALAAY